MSTMDVFRQMDGQRIVLFVEEKHIPQEKLERLSRLIEAFGGTTCSHPSQARIILVTRGTQEADHYLTLYGGEGGKPVLDYTWLEACVARGTLLESAADEWGGFLLTATKENDRVSPLEIREATIETPSESEVNNFQMAVTYQPPSSLASMFPTSSMSTHAIQFTPARSTQSSSQPFARASGPSPTPSRFMDLIPINDSLNAPSIRRRQRPSTMLPSSSYYESTYTGPYPEQSHQFGGFTRSSSVVQNSSPTNLMFMHDSTSSERPTSEHQLSNRFALPMSSNMGPSSMAVMPNPPNHSHISTPRVEVMRSLVPRPSPDLYHTDMHTPSLSGTTHDDTLQLPSNHLPSTNSFTLPQHPPPDNLQSSVGPAQPAFNQPQRGYNPYPALNPYYNMSMQLTHLAQQAVPIAFVPHHLLAQLPFLQYQGLGPPTNVLNATSTLPKQEPRNAPAPEGNVPPRVSDVPGPPESPHVSSSSPTKSMELSAENAAVTSPSPPSQSVPEAAAPKSRATSPSLEIASGGLVDRRSPSPQGETESSRYLERVAREKPSTQQTSREGVGETSHAEKRHLPRRATGPRKAIFTTSDGDALRFFIPAGVPQEMELLDAIKTRGGRGTPLDWCDYVLLESFSSELISRHRAKIVELGIPTIRPGWIHACIQAGRLVARRKYELEIPESAHMPVPAVGPGEPSGSGGEPLGKGKQVSADQSDPNGGKLPEDASIADCSSHTLFPGVQEFLNAEDESLLPSPPQIHIPHGTSYRFTHEDSQYLIDYANIRFAQTPGLVVRTILEEIAKNASHHSLYSWRRYFKDQRQVFEQYIHFPTPESARLDPEAKASAVIARPASPALSTPGSPFSNDTEILRDIHILMTEPAVPQFNAGDELFSNSANRYTEDEKQYFVDFLVWKYMKDPKSERASLTRELALKIPRHSEASWSSHWSRHIKDVARAQTLGISCASDANSDEIPCTTELLPSNDGPRTRRQAALSQAVRPALPAGATQAERSPLSGSNSWPLPSEQGILGADSERAGRRPKVLQHAFSGGQTSTKQSSSSLSHMTSTVPLGTCSHSGSPDPPKNIKKNSRGYAEYTSEDKEYVLDFIRWIVPKKPHISEIPLVEALAKRAPHHTRNRWMKFFKDNQAEINECIREASRRQTAKELPPTPPQTTPVQSLPSPIFYPPREQHVRTFLLPPRHEDCSTGEFEELVAYLERLQGPISFDEPTFAPFAAYHTHRTVQEWINISVLRSRDIQNALLERQTMLDSYIVLSDMDEEI